MNSTTSAFSVALVVAILVAAIVAAFGRAFLGVSMLAHNTTEVTTARENG